MASQDMWPVWWRWELEITPHMAKRMIDRQFNETELRTMLADTDDIEPRPGGLLYQRDSTRETDGLCWSRTRRTMRCWQLRHIRLIKQSM
jgi:hypothetical protein